MPDVPVTAKDAGVVADGVTVRPVTPGQLSGPLPVPKVKVAPGIDVLRLTGPLNPLVGLVEQVTVYITFAPETEGADTEMLKLATMSCVLVFR